MRRFLALASAALLLVGPWSGAAVARVPGHSGNQYSATRTATPIRHIVVIFQENVSFDHYFATYPNALNPSGEPAFHAAPNTPNVNGLTQSLLTDNPNLLNAGNGTGAANPFRLDRSQAATSDQDHDYTPEQQAFDAGLMDLFPEFTGTAGPPPGAPPSPDSTTGLVMGYYDGNTVTALWNYAQHYAMSDNSYGTMFGPSTVGAINLISGQTNGVITNINGSGAMTDGGDGTLTDTSDANPLGDVCSSPSGEQFSIGGKNIGDLLSSAGVTWGWFEGGFDLTKTNANGTTGCKRSTKSVVTGASETDYIPHHQPFQYYASTANLTHARPTSVALIGHNGDAANHQYDIDDFYAAVLAGNFPAVSFLKAPGYEDGHAGYSDPLDEQKFIVDVINFLQSQPDWSSTAVVISYDDSDGWYDHQIGPIVNQSTSASDALTGSGACGNGATALAGPNGNPHAQGRCGYGPRLPLMVISPLARHNFVDHTVTDQSSIIRFIEDNWLGGERVGSGSFDGLANSLTQMFDFHQRGDNDLYILNDTTGEVVIGPGSFQGKK
jgi:phospholipase C